jgi:hypothetical protein|tara:strand:+ start:1046 stop:1555 length:510 start_codon:yes stop_codon:yes gene_type:complete
MAAPKDFINDIERAIIDQLRLTFTDAHIYGQYPEAVDLEYPAIISEITSSGLFDKFMGEQISFGEEDKIGEVVGILFTYHLVIDKESKLSVTQDDESVVVYKGRRLLNYLMLNVANVLTDMGSDRGGEWYEGTEVLQQDLNNWSDVGYDPALEMYGASAVYMIAFKNYR